MDAALQSHMLVGFVLALGASRRQTLISSVLCVSEMMDYTERLQELQEIVKKFPPVNYQVFKYIITHLNR